MDSYNNRSYSGPRSNPSNCKPVSESRCDRKETVSAQVPDIADRVSESIKALTAELQTIRSRKKTNAQRCREYRERKKLEITMVQDITAERSDECSETNQLQVKKPKTNAERRKKHYEAQKLKKQGSKKIPKTVKQKNKDYYERKKKIKALNTLTHHSDASEEPPPADTVCRVCLIKYQKLFTVTNDLQNVYERVTREEYNKVGYPVCLCHICLTQLRRCQKFVETARDSNRVLEQWYHQQHEMKEHKPQITNTETKEERISIEYDEASLQNIKQEKMHVEPDYGEPETFYLEVKKENIDEEMDDKYDPNDNTYNDTELDNDRQEPKCTLLDQAPGPSSKFYIDDVKTVTNTTFEKIEIEINTECKDTNRHCFVCNFKCVTENDLSRHMRFHDSSRPHVCDVCQYRFEELIHLTKHKAMHKTKVVKTAEYLCDICDYKTINQPEFINHMISHTGVKQISCNICGFKTASQGSLVQHIRTHY